MSPAPAREDLLPVSTGNHCLFCGSRDWTWVYLLGNEPDWIKQLGWTFGWHVFMCDACHDYYEGGDDASLVRAHLNQPEPEADESEAVQWVRVVRARQSEPAIPRAEAIVPGVDDLVREGFTPIENLTGAHELAVVWPEAHRRSIPEVRAWALEDEALQGRLWAVRPPWPGWTFDDVFTYLWSLVDHYPEPQQRLDAAAKALHADESEARQQLQRARARDDR
jgi:hypothetical protein